MRVLTALGAMWGLVALLFALTVVRETTGAFRFRAIVFVPVVVVFAPVIISSVLAKRLFAKTPKPLPAAVVPNPEIAELLMKHWREHPIVKTVVGDKTLN